MRCPAHMPLPLQVLPWTNDDGSTNRHLLYVFLASCLAVAGVLGIYGMQAFIARGVAVQQQQQQQWKTKVAAAARQGGQVLAKSKAKLRGAAALVKPAGRQ